MMKSIPFVLDPDTQRSHDPVKEVRLLPAHEFPTDKMAIEGFRQRFREQFELAGRSPDSIYQQVTKGLWPAGIEYYLPLFFEQTATLLDYLPASSLLLTVGEIQQASEQFWLMCSNATKIAAMTSVGHC